MSGPASVLEAIRARTRQGFRTESGTLRLPLTTQQRREIARLVGTAWDVSGRPLRLEYLTAALAEHDLTVRGFVEALDGKALIDQRSQRAAEQAAAADERSEARSMLTAAGVPEACAEAWLTDTGLPRPGSGALASLAEQVAQVWRQLPGATGIHTTRSAGRLVAAQRPRSRLRRATGPRPLSPHRPCLRATATTTSRAGLATGVGGRGCPLR